MLARHRDAFLFFNLFLRTNISTISNQLTVSSTMNYDADVFDLPDSPNLRPFAPDIWFPQDEVSYADTFYGQFEFDGGALLGSESDSRIEAMIADGICQQMGDSTTAETKTVDTAVGTTSVMNVVLQTADIAQFHIGADQGLGMAFDLSQGNVLILGPKESLIKFHRPHRHVKTAIFLRINASGSCFRR
jgi:hypothetical protein